MLPPRHPLWYLPSHSGTWRTQAMWTCGSRLAGVGLSMHAVETLKGTSG